MNFLSCCKKKHQTAEVQYLDKLNLNAQQIDFLSKDIQACKESNLISQARIGYRKEEKEKNSQQSGISTEHNIEVKQNVFDSAQVAQESYYCEIVPQPKHSKKTKKFRRSLFNIEDNDRPMQSSDNET